MTNVTVFVFANQNEVSEKEAATIKQAIESANGIQVDIVANATFEQVEDCNGRKMIFATHDTNGEAYAKQVITFDAAIVFNGNKISLN